MTYIVNIPKFGQNFDSEIPIQANDGEEWRIERLKNFLLLLDGRIDIHSDDQNAQCEGIILIEDRKGQLSVFADAGVDKIRDQIIDAWGVLETEQEVLFFTELE